MGRAKHDKVTVAEIAKVCGVSPATVSRVLYNRPYVTEEIRAKIRREIERSGYVFQHNSRLGKILVITPTAENIIHGEYYYELCNHLESCFQSAGYEILICCAAAFPHIGHVGFDAVISLSYDSLIFDYWSTHLVAPLIYVNRELSVQAPNCFHVDSDHRQALRSAVRLCFNHGHRRIGLLIVGHEAWNFSQNQAEKEGFLLGTQQLDIGDSAFYQYTDDLEPHHALTELLRHKITALIVPNITEGGKVARILQDLRWNIPEDISVVVGESSFYNQVNSIALTTLKMPYEKMAQSCLEIIRGEHKSVLLPYELLERDSVAEIIS